MKKFLSLLLSSLLLCSLLPTASAAGETFTLMIYLCGTDLETQGSAATSDLQEMVRGRIPQNGNLTLYVQTGGTLDWQIDGITDGQSERWLVSQAGLELVDRVGTANMGDASVFADFLSFGFENYPADRYGLIMWDHGSGASGGLCYDELTGDPLYYPEIHEGLSEASQGRGDRTFAFIGFDACLMASYELANHIAPFADYMIASEELEPGSGWCYDKWLPSLAQNPGISMETLGKTIVDSFIGSLSQSFLSGDYGTLSLCDLRQLPALQQATERMGEALSAQIEAGNFASVSRQRQSMRSFGEISDAASDMIDMAVFAQSFSKFDAQAASAIASALEDVVIYSSHTSNLDDISGLSILVPYSTRAYFSDYLPHYETLKLSPNYADFVKTMAEAMSSGSSGHTFSNVSVGVQSYESAQIDWFSQYAIDVDSYYGQADSFWGDSFDSFELDSFLSAIFGQEDMTGFEDSWGWEDDSWWEGEPETPASHDSGWGSPTPDEPEEESPSSGFIDSVFEAVSGSQMTIPTDDGEVTLENPFAGINSDYAYTLQLTEEQLDVLGQVEANLMMDVSDPDFECYVELGYVQEVVVDWNRGHVYGLFDGTWATLDGQMVCMYDQIVNERYIRSLIPVTVNGDPTYLLVIFDEETPGGRVVSYTEGYTDVGLPARGSTSLEPGDVVVPEYELIYWDEYGEQQYEPFWGDEIIVGADISIPFGYEPVEGDVDYCYGFCLTDIYGDSTFTDFYVLSY